MTDETDRAQRMLHLSVMIRPATAHGWLRRRDLDKPGQFVWEKPDGTLVAESHDITPRIATMLPKRPTP